MKKTFKVNEKKLTKRYNKKIFIACLPAIAVLFSLILIVYLMIYHKNPPIIMYYAIFYTLNGTIGYTFLCCLIGSIIETIRIKGHKTNTYIEILNSDMVVSQHMRSYFINKKLVHFKKLWVIPLKDIESASCDNGIITIKAPARLFYQDADWLKYECGDNGIKFEHWWYDENGGIPVQTVEFKDYYTYGKSIVRRILYCQRKYQEREERRNRFRNEMLSIASNTPKQTGISQKYNPVKKNPFM